MMVILQSSWVESPHFIPRELSNYLSELNFNSRAQLSLEQRLLQIILSKLKNKPEKDQSNL